MVCEKKVKRASSRLSREAGVRLGAESPDDGAVPGQRDGDGLARYALGRRLWLSDRHARVVADVDYRVGERSGPGRQDVRTRGPSIGDATDAVGAPPAAHHGAQHGAHGLQAYTSTGY